MEFTIAAHTDVGTEKSVNQDSMCFRRVALSTGGEAAMAVVCDGMGGLQKGELASAECIRAFCDWFDKELNRFPAMCSNSFAQIRQQWGSMLIMIHSKLKTYSQQANVQMGTTVAAIFLYGNRYLTVHIGDSRIYARNRELTQLTQDHSLVANEVAAGRITEDEARHHPQRNLLLQCLGSGNTVAPAFSDGNIQNNMMFLLCSDGFIRELSSEEIYMRLNPMQLGSKEAMAIELADLTSLCMKRGETDNITSILIRAKESMVVQQKSGFRGFFERKQAKVTSASQTALKILESETHLHTMERATTG